MTEETCGAATPDVVELPTTACAATPDVVELENLTPATDNQATPAELPKPVRALVARRNLPNDGDLVALAGTRYVLTNVNNVAQTCTVRHPGRVVRGKKAKKALKRQRMRLLVRGAKVTE